MNAMSIRPFQRRRGGLSRNGGVRLALTALFGLTLLIARAAAGDVILPSKEYRLKAAFLYNFTKFVDWPPGRFPSADSPIVIGILGENPFGEELETIVRDRRVNGRTLAVRLVATADEAASVHILFVGAGQEAGLPAMLELLRRNNVLTVGEAPDFAVLGGIITFVLDGDKIRFAIDLSSGKRAGVALRAQLLNLAIKGRTAG